MKEYKYSRGGFKTKIKVEYLNQKSELLMDIVNRGIKEGLYAQIYYTYEDYLGNVRDGVFNVKNNKEPINELEVIYNPINTCEHYLLTKGRKQHRRIAICLLAAWMLMIGAQLSLNGRLICGSFAADCVLLYISWCVMNKY